MGYAYMCEARDLLMFIVCVTPHPNVLVSFMRTFFCYYIRTPAKQSHGMRFRMIEFISTIQANCGTNSAAGKATVAWLPVIILFLRDLSVFTFNKMTSKNDGQYGQWVRNPNFAHVGETICPPYRKQFVSYVISVESSRTVSLVDVPGTENRTSRADEP